VGEGSGVVGSQRVAGAERLILCALSGLIPCIALVGFGTGSALVVFVG